MARARIQSASEIRPCKAMLACAAPALAQYQATCERLARTYQDDLAAAWLAYVDALGADAATGAPDAHERPALAATSSHVPEPAWISAQRSRAYSLQTDARAILARRRER